MKTTFNQSEHRLDITNCEFENVEIYFNGQSVADIPLTDGNGFVTNIEILNEGDVIEVYPYNRVEVQL